MSRYEQPWCDDLVEAASAASFAGDGATVLYVVTDTEEGKVAFHLQFTGDSAVVATAGKLPRGHKADITVTIKEPVLAALWSGERTRDEAFMAGDIKVEGAYNRWLDEMVPLFQSEPWATAWAAA